MSEEAFFDFLAERTQFLDGVSITGGEPCLHADLPEFCAKIKAMGFLVKLDTNGSLPQVTAGLIEKRLVDYIAMDVKTAPERYEPLSGPVFSPDTLIQSIDLIKNSGLPCEFRTTCVRPFVDEAAVTRIADLIAGAPLYVLQHCGKERMLDPDFFKQDPVIGPEEMERLKNIAQNKVGRCIIR
jgi:pyruvate formate lyase activating enzyme